MPTPKLVLTRTISKPKPCTVRGCRRLRHMGQLHCQSHHNANDKKGNSQGISLARSCRRPYIRSCQAILKQLMRHHDAPATGLLHALTAIFRHRIDRTVTLAQWRLLKPKLKAQAVLLNIHQRYPIDDDAALVLASTVLGVILCCRVEPDVPRDEWFARFAIMRAVSTLIKPEGKPSPGWKRPRPFPTGRLIVGRLHDLLSPDIRFFLRESPHFEATVLTHMLTGTSQRAIRLNPDKQGRMRP
jgi:hypothetical protein